MNYAMLLNIILGCFVFVGAVLAFILAYLLGKTSQRENNNLAYVFVDYGQQVSPPIKAKRTYTSNKGIKYSYRVSGKTKEVLVPITYAVKYHKSRRMIFVNSLYSLISSPSQDDIALSSSEREDLVYNLTSSQLISQAVQAFKGKMSMSIVIIAIVFALVLGIGGTYLLTRPKAQIQQTTQQTQPTTTILPPAK